jgi:hypothetical protein
MKPADSVTPDRRNQLDHTCRKEAAMKKFASLASSAVLALALGTAMVPAHADSLVTTAPTGSDTLDWSQFGSQGSAISSSFSFTTNNSVSGTGSYANGAGEVWYQGNWAGNFAPGAPLNYNTTSGAITLNFGEGYTQIGAQIMSDDYGSFTAQICDANGCFTEDGVSNGDADNSAIYIGVSSGDPITWVTFSLTDAPNGTTDDFALGNVVLGGGSSATPEPSSLALLGTGIVGAGAAMRRRLVRS